MKRLVAVAVALAVPAAALAQSTWNVDPAHTHSSFTIRHLVISNVRGEFGKTTGTVKLDEKDVTKSSVEATIETTTIDTRVADRDNHLRSPDFFDVAKYPAITFKSTRVEAAGEGKLKVTGNLTIKDVTRPVTVDFEYTGAAVDPFGNHRIGLEGTTTVNRKDWGVNWNAALETGGVLVSEKVTLEFEVSAIRTDA